MENKIENFEEESRLKIRNQTFSNEIDLNPCIKWNALARIIFLNCRFEELDLLGKVFGSCDFKNCKFNNLSFRKCQFSNCRFKNCQIINSDLTRAAFHDCSFRNCEFLKSDLAASNFWNCEFSETKFKNNNLDLIIARFGKVCNSKQSIKIEKSSNFEKIQKEINEMIEKLRLGNEQCGRGRKTLFQDGRELIGDKGGRVYYRKSDGKIEILAKSGKVKRD